MPRLARFVRSSLVTTSFLVALPASTSAFQGAPLCMPEWTVRTLFECSPLDPERVTSDANIPTSALLPTAARLRSEGDLDAARRVLREAAYRFPRVADRIALLEAEMALEQGFPEEARELYESARTSPSPEVRIVARVGSVRTMLETDDARGPRALRELLEDYPELPETLALELAAARGLERAGRTRDAVAAYRRIDLDFPGSPLSAEAREALEALRARGVDVPELSREERIERVERLVRSGPTSEASDELTALLFENDLSEAERRTLLRLSLRVARAEARFEDAARIEAELGETKRASPRDVSTPEERHARALAEFRALARGRTALRVPESRLVEVARLAVMAGLEAELASVVDRAATGTYSHNSKFHVAMVASGSPADGGVLRVLHTLTNLADGVGGGARYHYARTLERLGRSDDANAAFARVEAEGGYYAMWAAQRAHRAIADARTTPPDGTVVDEELVSRADAGLLSGSGDEFLSLAPTSPSAEPDPEADAKASGARGAPDLFGDFRSDVPEDLAPFANRLADVAARRADAYPWLGRAEDLLRLGDRDGAAAELYDVLIAHRAASGRGVHRAGLDAVARGRDAARRASASLAARHPRAPLAPEDRDLVAGIAKDLGEWGTAIAFGGAFEADSYPRPYEAIVEAAARRYEVDPDLVYAVMRVESVYQPRIVSYAGAIGLLQIMPRTGRLIARQLGRRDFTERDLLDPRVNVEFGAYYLASLTRRFDGRVPLAIASYNGGPHNVRTWMRESGPAMPLDAFLERIPFDQTYRYVRRVLTHYAAYRAKRGLPMVELHVTLPTIERDTVGF